MVVFILTLVILNLSVFGVRSINVEFTGFEEGSTYIYTLNGVNAYKNLTCRANADNESISFQTAWYENGSSSVLERETLHFSRVAEYTGGDKLRRYYCMATSDSLSILSKDIFVQVVDNSTITINYNDNTEVRTNNINHTLPILVPVLARDLVLTCNAEGPGWRYTDKGTNKLEQVQGDRLEISVLSLDWMRIDCTRKAGVYPAFVATGIVLIPIGSAIGFEETDGSFSLFEDSGRLEITQNTTVICATSDITATNWFYSMNGSDGSIGGSDSISVDKSELKTRGMVKLVISYPLPTEASGYYSCRTYEKVSDTNSKITKHTIEIVAAPNDLSADPSVTTANTENVTQTVVGNTTQTIVSNKTTQPTSTTMLPTTNSTPIESTTTSSNETIQTNTTTQTTAPTTVTQNITSYTTILNATTQPTTTPTTATQPTTTPTTTAQTTTTPTTATQTTPSTTTQTTTIPSTTTQTTTTPSTTTQTTTTPSTTTQTTTTPSTTTQTTTTPSTTTQTTTTPTTTQTTTTPSTTTQTTTTPSTTTQTTTTPSTTTQTTTTPSTTTQYTTTPSTTTQTTTTPSTTTQSTTTPSTTTQTTTTPSTTTQTTTTPSTTTQTTTTPSTTTQTTSTPSTTTQTTTTPSTTKTTTTPSTTTQTTTTPSTTTQSITALSTDRQINVSPTPTRTILLLRLLAPYIGVTIGLLVILVSLCILVMCLCCILKRKPKMKLWNEELALAPQDEMLGYNKPSTRYTQLKDSHTPAAVQISLNSIEVETQLISPIRTLTKGSYSKLEESDSFDILTVKDVSNNANRIESPMSGSVLSQTSVTKYQDDPNAALIELQHYKQHLDNLLLEERMEREYDALGGLELRHDCEHAFLAQNYNKNKYKMIYPYDKSRVVIKDISSCGSDYINASHIPGFYISEHFIAAQAPKPNTLSSFWHMIWEQGVRTIVSLTNRVELGKTKCMLYWPENIGDSVEYGLVNVSLQKEEEFVDYTVRDLIVSGVSNRKIRTKQLHYTAWSDHNTPQLYNNLLAFIQVVKERERKIRSSPILVHCTAGVGRSGTFLALYNLQDAIDQGVSISVYRLVNEMREHRPHMVQTFLQYKYIYLAILEMIMGCTSIFNDDFRDTFSLYLQAEEPGYLSVFKLQFEELNYQTEKCFDHQCTVCYYPENVARNTADTTVPFDFTRVVLSSPSCNCDYVNASYINGNRLIAAQLPREETLQEFLQLVYQLDNPIVVVLLSRQEYEAVRRGSSDIIYFWSEEKGCKEFGAFKVEMESMIKSPFYIQQRMNVYSGYENQQRSFCQYISFYWGESDKSLDAAAAITLLDHVSISLAEDVDKSAIFCCRDSIGKSGIMLAVLLSVLNMKESGSVDIFQIVKRLRNSRKNMVPTIEHYISCYSLLDEYFRLNMT